MYAGGLAFSLSAAGWFDYLSSKTGSAGDLAWAILILLVLAGVAEAFARTGHRVTAGVFAFGAVLAAVATVAQLFDWFDWNTDHAIRGFDVPRLLVELAWLAAAAAALRRYRFPLLVAQLVGATWLFVADLVSGGGTWTAAVTIVLGFCALAVAAALDAMGSRAYAFWVHVGAGLMIGAGALWCVRHGGTLSWLLILVAAVGYIWIARVLGRSSWAVLGTLGIFIVATHFALRWSHVSVFFFDNGRGGHAWAAPLVYSAAAALVVALGLWVSRRPAAD